MAIDHFTIAAGEHRNLEAELADAAAHAIDDCIVLARVACVENEPVERPDLDLPGLRRCFLREHTSPSDGSDWRCLSEGALCAGLANRASNIDFTPELTSCATLLSTVGMERGWRRGTGWFRTCEVEIHYDRVLTASDDDGFTGFVGESVDLLVRYERRNIDEITCSGFTAELEAVAPPHASPAANYVEDGFELAVVMRSSLCVGLDYHRAGPQLACSRSGVRNSGRPSHAGSLRCVRVQIAG